jgi:tetraacyldisaccharide 4'-kinase
MKLYWPLFPLAVLFDSITRFRNHLYNIGLRPSVQFDIPVISVGNLAVGGTGKTPMVEYLVRILADRYEVAVLSRGYGRKTRGFLLAGEGHTAADLGDEPLQIYRKYGNQILVAVCEERIIGIPELLTTEEELEAIILDDAFQHRKLRPSFSVVLTDFNRPFFKDWVMPVGRLREARKGISRADLVVVTKCPENLPAAEKTSITENIRKYAGKKLPVFFAHLRYLPPVDAQGTPASLPQKAILITGIVNPLPLKNYLEQSGVEIVKDFQYADHADYTPQTLTLVREALQQVADEEVAVVTTEKDLVKLQATSLSTVFQGRRVLAVPVEMQLSTKDLASLTQMLAPLLANTEG